MTDSGTVPAVCPSCGAAFKKPPLAKTRCRTCGQHAHVRSVQTILPRTLVTPCEASALDSLRLIDGMMQGPLADAVRIRLAQGESISEAFVTEADAFGHWYVVAMHLAACGRDPAPVLRKQHARALKDYATLYGPGSIVQVRPAPNACASCRAQLLKEFSAAEALVAMPLPHPGCTRPLRHGQPAFCRCTYTWAGPHRMPLPTEAIPELELLCFGGPRDGARVTLHNLRPVYMAGELAGYLADDEPTPTDEGAYVVTERLRLEWTARIPD